ncbi:MAG: hypothetical protein LUC24_06925, partial [Bacteroidales bacterium]|nr:hypothetical protein [Bacteroidales bacterium]
GRISVDYTSSYGKLSQIFTVVQNSGEAPVLSVQPTAVTVTAEGGSSSFSYNIENPLEGGELYCSTTADWISGLNYSATSARGDVTFTVAANETGSLRQADISVVYSSDYGILEQTVAVVQDHGSNCEGGGDTGDFDGDVSDLIGTYTAHGMAYADAGVAGETTWTLTIYPSEYDDLVIIDGLVPDSADFYPVTEAYIAQAYLDSNGRLVIPTQLTGYTHPSTGFFIGWTPCVAYVEGEGWSYYNTWPSTTLTYASSTETWTSDYGEFLGLFTVTSTYQIDEFQGLFDVTNPGFTITKTSSSTSSMTSDGVVSHPIDEHLVLHKDYLIAK